MLGAMTSLSNPLSSPADAVGGAAEQARRERRGLAWGFVGVALFALTLPMTRIAVGPASQPELSPLFATAGRAAFAGLLSIAWLGLMRAAWPSRAQWRALAVSALGVVLGFPLCLALALREVPAMHAAVVTGLLPLATAVVGALVLRQRASAGFWLAALAGFGLVLAFALTTGGGLQKADALLLGAVISASIGYVWGARVSAELGPEATICWTLVLALPLALPLAAWHWPAQPVGGAAWLAFGYLGLVSMWLGFFAWYRGLALGGTLRVSQVQLLQPFLALLAAVPLLGEALEAETVGFALAVLATVVIGRRCAVGPTASARRPVSASGSAS